MVVSQPDRGFRYSVDAFWLAGAALGVPAPRVLDLCTGSGIVAWLLAAEGRTVTAIDVEPGWRAHWSASSGPQTPSFQVSDLRELEGQWDLVTCNPPYRADGQGPPPSGDLRAGAEVELNGTLREVHRAACALAPRVLFVLPRKRADELPSPTLRWSIGRRRCLLGWGIEGGERELEEQEADRLVRRARGLL